MRELPIIYSSPMILAKLAGRKTMTRRTVGLELINQEPDNWEFVRVEIGNVVKGPVRLFALFINKMDSVQAWIPCPYGQPGDVLYARETWAVDWEIGENSRGEGPSPFFYKATDTHPFNPPYDKWKPSIHMPKAAARIWDEVVSIKVERVQDITEEDAIAEGLSVISKDGCRTWKYGIADRDGLPGNDDFGWSWADWNVDSREAFFSLWRRINGEESFKLNPWLWAVTIKNLSTTGKPEL